MRMIFMTAFWVILGAGLAVYAIAKKYAKSSNADDFATAALLLAAAFLVVGIAKNDPLFAQFGVPA